MRALRVGSSMPGAPSATVCGFHTDCEASYRPEDINSSAAAWFTCNSTAQSLYRARSVRAADACTATASTGAYCLPHLELGAQPRVASGFVRRVELPHNQSYLLPYDEPSPKMGVTHYEADGRVVGALAELANTYRHGIFLNDFGAGVGQYGHALLAMRPNTKYLGYDGGEQLRYDALAALPQRANIACVRRSTRARAAGNVGKWTNGFVHWFDLTVPLALPRAEWVLSVEVGEHIPSKFEGTYLRNLHAHNCAGVILSWAALGQNGANHINNHKATVIRARMASLGYFVNETLTHALRYGAGMPRTVRIANIAAFERYKRVSPCTAHPPCAKTHNTMGPVG